MAQSAEYTVRVRDPKTQMIMIQRQRIPTMVDVRAQIMTFKQIKWSRKVEIDVLKHVTVVVKAPKASKFKW